MGKAKEKETAEESTCNAALVSVVELRNAAQRVLAAVEDLVGECERAGEIRKRDWNKFQQHFGDKALERVDEDRKKIAELFAQIEAVAAESCRQMRECHRISREVPVRA